MYEEMGASVARRAEKAAEVKRLGEVGQSERRDIIKVRGSKIERPEARAQLGEDDEAAVEPKKSHSKPEKERLWGQPRPLDEEIPTGGTAGSNKTSLDSNGAWNSDIGSDRKASAEARFQNNSRAALSTTSGSGNNSGITWGGASSSRDEKNSGDQGGPVPVPNLY